MPIIASPQPLAALFHQPCDGAITPVQAERREGNNLQTIELSQDATSSLLILIGPEEGWNKAEMQMAEQAGVEFITLGQKF